MKFYDEIEKNLLGFCDADCVGCDNSPCDNSPCDNSPCDGGTCDSINY